MLTTNKKWIIHIIHHSHTDVGYTDNQEKIALHHAYFIKEVVEILNDPKNTDFKWNCESYWGVEQFLKHASLKEKEDFFKFVKEGRICVSGNYLNLTDIVGERVLKETIASAAETMKKEGVILKSALTADINGYSWGYADTLIDNGVSALMSCIHTHHGYHPLFKKQTPFYWVSPKGQKLLVWNGEHYLVGNELGIAQASEFHYTIQDNYFESDPFIKAENRIFAYVNTLSEQDYPYDFVPVSVSGNMTDNSPPSLAVLDFIYKFNAKHSGQIELKMSTLDEFFDCLRSQKNEIPEFKGDWTDWWADGVGSTPAVLKQYRNALRKYEVINKLDPEFKIVPSELIDKARYNLMFYSEHTWGYSSSITEPWHPMVNNLQQWKNLYALKANDYTSRGYDKLTFAMGETQISLNKDYRFGAVNPHDIPVTDMLIVDVEHMFGHSDFEITDEKTGENVPYQMSRYSRGIEFCLLLELKPKEKRTYLIRDKNEKKKLSSAGTFARTPIEGIYDLNRFFLEDLQKTGSMVSPYRLENKFFIIEYETDKGIVKLFDKISGRDLIKPSFAYAPFTPVYEVTPIQERSDYLWERRNMGRNRKALSTVRDYGKLYNVKVIEDGSLFSRIELDYRLQGTQASCILLTAYKYTPRIDIDFRLHKNSVHCPENVYLCLPLTSGSRKEEMWIDKTGALLRPRIDQLPGTCTDFYSVQNGIAFIGEKNSIALTAPDAPLIMMGEIKSHPIKLMGEEGVNNIDDTYAWVMNNFWETNFCADLGGFHQFRYTLINVDSVKPAEVFAACEAVNQGVPNFYSFDIKK